MAEHTKQAIAKVLERTRTARTELELEDISYKAETLAQGAVRAVAVTQGRGP